MELEPYQLARFTPCQNFVLTTTVYATDIVKLNDLELKVDTTYNPAAFSPIVQRVVRVPKQLIFGRDTRYITLDKGFDPAIQHNRQETVSIRPPAKHSMPHKCDMELKPDDVVYVDGHTLLTAESENRVIECEGVKHYLIKYDDIYFRLENGVPYMLNSWILVEPITAPEDTRVKKLKDMGIVFPGISITLDNRKEMGVQDKMGVVRHIGIPVSEHMEPEQEELDEISVGQVVVFKWGANRRLEFSGARFFGETELVVTKRSRLVASIVENALF